MTQEYLTIRPNIDDTNLISGIITCDAVNEGITLSSKEYNLRLISKPVVTVSPITITVQIGALVSLRCLVTDPYTNDQNPPIIIWYRDNKAIPRSEYCTICSCNDYVMKGYM